MIMKVDFRKILIDPRGQKIEIKNETGEKEVLTLSRVAYEALLANTDEKETDKYELYKLSKKTVQNKEVEISAKEIGIIEDRIKKVWATLVAGAAIDMLENLK